MHVFPALKASPCLRVPHIYYGATFGRRRIVSLITWNEQMQSRCASPPAQCCRVKLSRGQDRARDALQPLWSSQSEVFIWHLSEKKTKTKKKTFLKKCFFLFLGRVRPNHYSPVKPAASPSCCPGTELKNFFLFFFNLQAGSRWNLEVKKQVDFQKSCAAWSEAAGDPLKGDIWSLMIKSGRVKRESGVGGGVGGGGSHKWACERRHCAGVELWR